MDKKDYSLEEQYQLYLKLVKLTEDGMSSVQRNEMKQCFMAACGQMFILLQDISKLPEEEGFKILNDIGDQVDKYFANQVKNFTKNLN